MHIGFNVSDAALPDLAVIFFENKCQLGVRFPDTADQILFLRKPGKAFLDDTNDLVGILQRAAGRHRHIDAETVALHLFSVLDIQGDRKDQAKEQQDDGPKDRHTGIPHAGLQQHQIDLYRPLRDRYFFIKDRAPIRLPQYRIGSHRNEKEGDSERDQESRDDGNADMVSHQLDQKIIGKDEWKEDRNRC